MTEFCSNINIRDNWNHSRKEMSYKKLTLTPSFLKYFSDENKFLFTKEISINKEIDDTLYQLQISAPFSFENEKEVLEYIHTNNDLLPAIIDAITASVEIFPKNKRVLSLHNDPESDDKFLILSIKFTKYPNNLYELMNMLDDRCIHSLEMATEGWISVIPDHI